MTDADEKTFAPEIGQMLFGQPWQKDISPWRDEAFLDLLREFIEIGVRKEAFVESPFVSSWGIKFPSFVIEGYSWDDEYDQPYNFFFFPNGYKISWYKHAHRSRTANMELSDTSYMAMVDTCLKEVYKAIADSEYRREYVEEGFKLAKKFNR